MKQRKKIWIGRGEREPYNYFMSASDLGMKRFGLAFDGAALCADHVEKLGIHLEYGEQQQFYIELESVGFAVKG